MLNRKRKSHRLAVSSFWLKKMEDRQFGVAVAVRAMLNEQNSVVVPLQWNSWSDEIVAQC